MIQFTCIICGTANERESIPFEETSCVNCLSNVRKRAVVYMLSTELFGEARPLSEFPHLPEIRGFGMSDDLSYALPLAERLGYLNTFYDHEPLLDITGHHPDQYGSYDFIISSDVLEHVPIPVERALEEAHRLLKADGVFVITVPSTLEEETIEHYPDLHEYAVAQLGSDYVLVNRKRDGGIELHRDLVFHGGPGSTLEMRMFARKDLEAKLRSVGFREVCFLDDAAEQWGIVLNLPWAHPLLARKERRKEFFSCAKAERKAEPAEAPPAVTKPPDELERLRAQMETLEQQMSSEIDSLRQQLAIAKDQAEQAANSKWLRLGQRLGLGPRLG